MTRNKCTSSRQCLFVRTWSYMKNKNDIDATYYFIVLLIGSTCFGHYYAHHQELENIMLITTLVVSFLVCCRLEVTFRFSLQPGHYSSLTAPNLQPTANQGMYNFRYTILINTNHISNYQSTSETHYTQENTTITTHKGSQLLILIEARYQLQPSDKELHTEHTPLRTIILH
jgi:hypothetical protein